MTHRRVRKLGPPGQSTHVVADRPGFDANNTTYDAMLSIIRISMRSNCIVFSTFRTLLPTSTQVDAHIQSYLPPRRFDVCLHAPRTFFHEGKDNLGQRACTMKFVLRLSSLCYSIIPRSRSGFLP